MENESALFKALSDPTRLRLAVLLALRGETCVCELAAALEAPDYRVSRHLGVLRAAGLVAARREGAWMQYRLAEARSELERHLQEGLRACLSGHPVVGADLARLGGVHCGQGASCDG